MRERKSTVTTSFNRRRLLKGAAGASTAALLGANALRPLVANAQQAQATETPTPLALGEGDIKISIWVQNFGASIDRYKNAAQKYVADHKNVSVSVQPIAYADLMAKMLPSVAAGTEADIMQGYTDWYVGTDITRLFLPLDEYLGGLEKIKQSLFPTTLTVVAAPEGKLYYMPYAAGIRGAALTVNVKQCQDAGIDYMKWANWDDVVAAGQELTVKEGDKITRAGLSPVTALLVQLKTWIWQLGGEFYDQESGKWSLSTPEGEQAMQLFYDLFWGPKPTSSYDLITADNEFTSFDAGRIAIEMNGAWTVGNHEADVPELKADAIPTPNLAGAKQDVVFPDQISVTTLSRRLAKDKEKLDHCIGILQKLFDPELLLDVTQGYSGAFCNKDLYANPQIDETKYGPISKRIAEGVWPKARYPQDHVANQAPALTELDRAMRKEISIKEALANADKYLNGQEKQARERIG
jgi:ABC-type glycerol-3-phosphate transport system substrate-binding protein